MVFPLSVVVPEPDIALLTVPPLKDKFPEFDTALVILLADIEALP